MYIMYGVFCTDCCFVSYYYRTTSNKSTITWTSVSCLLTGTLTIHLAALITQLNPGEHRFLLFMVLSSRSRVTTKVWILQMPRLSQHPHVLCIESDTPHLT